MARSVGMISLGLATSVAMLAGCGPDRSGPEENGSRPGVSLSELKAAPTAPGGTRRVTWIQPVEPTPQHLLWERSARLESSKREILFSTRRPGADQQQADLVRSVAREGGSAVMIVVPGPDEDLADAVGEARDRGISVLSLREELRVEGDVVPAVVRGDLEPAAKELVAAVVEDAPKLERSASGPALVVFVSEFPESLTRANVLFQTAREAGVELIGEGPMAIPDDQQAGSSAIMEVRAEHPGLSMVLAGDDPSFASAIAARNLGSSEERFAVSGFIVDPALLEFVGANYASAAAFADEQVLGIFAVRSALELIEGEELADRIATPLPVRRASGPPAPIPTDLDPRDELPENLPGRPGLSTAGPSQ